jgi:hypothetical protein
VIEIDELEMMCGFGGAITGAWIFKDELDTWRGVSQQLYAQIMGWA